MNDLEMDNSLSFTEDHNKLLKPKPADFETFIPWACKEYAIGADIIVTRAAQKEYVSSVATSAKKKTSIKTKKLQPLLPSVTSLEDVIHSSVLEKAKTSYENKIMMETSYNSNDYLVHLKLLKNKVLPRRVMQVIALTLPYQKHLTSITINSGLRMDSLYEISKFLPNSYVTELCLDNTFLRQANYHTLLTLSKLKHLSLAKCKINDVVVQTIAEQLKNPCPASRILSALNLSSNRITDVGAKYIANMLRTNRQLSYLNVAGNMISDIGGISILGTLHEFPVQTQELLESRARYVAYLKKKKVLIGKYFIELQTGKFDRIQKRKITRRGKQEKQSLHHLASQKPCIDSGVEIMQKKAEYLAESTMGVFNEPFSKNNTKSRDGVVHCFGNNTLCYLNIAYNNLTYVSLKKLHEVLSSQKARNRTPRGLVKVVIEGNLMPVACEEYDEIDYLLKSNVDDLRKQSEINGKLIRSRSTSIATTK